MRKMLVAALGFLLETVLSPGPVSEAVALRHLRPPQQPPGRGTTVSQHLGSQHFSPQPPKGVADAGRGAQQQGLQWSMAEVGAEGGGAVEQKAEEQRKKQTNRLRRNEAARRYQDEKEEQERLRRQCQSPPSLIELQPVAPLQGGGGDGHLHPRRYEGAVPRRYEGADDVPAAAARISRGLTSWSWSSASRPFRCALPTRAREPAPRAALQRGLHASPA